ncbi:MAG: SurA N-terminal domain-containing protein [Myxococcales bacterium]|nr:SurA N-terminal domain-containing protein [Myxococcales bacterium]
MLEFIRRQSTSAISWLILGAIAITMGVTFGGPSDMLSAAGVKGIAEVYGHEIRNEDYRFQSNLAARFGLIPKEPQMREMIGVNEELIDGMVERLLLAEEARKMGLAATDEEAEDMVVDGHVMLFGYRRDRLAPDETFNYELFAKGWLGSLQVAEPNYLEEQSDELLAQTLRDVIAASVVIPETEVRREYDKGANTLSLRYARYEFAAFADLVEPTPEQIDAYVAEHADELVKTYESQSSRFTALPKQARLSLVQVPAGDESRAALEAERAAIVAGTKTFADVARERSTHDTKARGGDYGWIEESSDMVSDLPDAVRGAIAGLGEGEPSEPIEADGSLWLLRVEGRREGDVPKEEALRELAAEGLRDQLAEDLARRAAEEDQNAVTAGNALEDVFSQPGVMGETTLFGGTTIEDLPLDGEAGEGSEGSATPGDPAQGRRRPKAEMRSTGSFVKGQSIPNLGMVPELIDDAWAFDGEAELLGGIYEVPGAVVLAGVEDKKEASAAEYAEQRNDIYERLRRLKARKVTGAFAQRRCLDAKSQGDIKVSEETIKRLTTYDAEEEEEGEDAEAPKPDKPPYSVCDRVGGGGGLLTARIR